jgi:hypothetical protein
MEQIMFSSKKINTIAMGLLSATFLLTACGGGGGNTTAAPGTFYATPTSVPKVAPASGDYFVYDLTQTPTSGASTSATFTRAYPAVNADGSSVEVTTYSDSILTKTANLDVDFGITSVTFVSAGVSTVCTNTPRDIGPTYPASKNSNWNSGWTQVCTGAAPSISQFSNQGTLTALESVTTPAGTFYAGKEVFTVTEVRTNAYTRSISYTCWVDTLLGRVVKCLDTYTFTPIVGLPSSGSELITLRGYSAAGISSVPTVARFAGTWSGSYTGTANSGSCASLTVSTTGVISGACVDVHVGNFTVSGSVNVAGIVSMLASTGVTFSGTFSSTTSASGNWAGVPSGGGSWTASR